MQIERKAQLLPRHVLQLYLEQHTAAGKASVVGYAKTTQIVFLLLFFKLVLNDW